MRIQAQFPALPLNAEQLAQRSKQRRLLFGWAIVCTVDGVDYYDSYKTHIPEDEMYQAAVAYFTKSREGRHNHEGPLTGTVEYSLPLTNHVASMFGLKSRKTGWLIVASARSHDDRPVRSWGDSRILDQRLGGHFRALTAGSHTSEAPRRRDQRGGRPRASARDDRDRSRRR